MTPNPPRKHHYLPEFYTKKWAGESGQMTRYALLPGGKFERRRVAPGAIGFRKDLYTLPMYEADSAYSLELELFGKIDHYAAITIGELIKGNIPHDHKSKVDIAIFLQSINLRSPDALIQDILSFDEEFRNEAIKHSGGGKALKLAALLRLYHVSKESELGLAIINMNWKVYDLRSGNTPLLTGDYPFLVARREPMPTGIWPHDSAIDSFLIPISPWKLLVGKWNARGPIPLESMTPARLAKTVNKYMVQMASEFVISTIEENEKFILRNFGLLRDKPQIPDSFRDII